MSSLIGTDVRRAAQLLRDGRLVAFATETVYGLGAHALDPRAVARVFEAKQRPFFDPLICHVADPGAVASLVIEFDDRARALSQRFWPGPLTLVLPKADVVPDLVTAGLQTVGVRVPDHPLTLEMLCAAGIPVAAPSANLFGRISPTTAEHVADQLADRVDYILDGGPCRVGLESTVVDLSTSQARLLRPGGLPLEEIERVIGRVALIEESEHPVAEAQPAPGMLPRHYAPRTPLVIADEDQQAPAGSRIGLLAFMSPADVNCYAAVEILSASGDLTEAAANFFAALRRLDERGLDAIVARSLPETGLGRALNDRLRRAARE